MFETEYRNKRIGPEAAARLVHSGDWVDYNMSQGMPLSIDRALAQRRDELTDVKVRGMLALRPLAIVEQDPQQQAFHYVSWFLSGYERELSARGLCSYIPMQYKNLAEIYRKCLWVDVAFLRVPPMDAHGYFNFSLYNSATRAILETAKVVVLEVNELLPRTLGSSEECIHISDVDYIVEGEPTPPETMMPAEPNDQERAIARNIMPYICNGATIQLGIGGLPNAIGTMIAESDLSDLGMHTEMLNDAYLEIFKSGKLTNKYKKVDRHKGVWTFSLGSPELYAWAENNPGLTSYPASYTNSPEIMGRNDHLITINSCLEADIFGQVSSESTSQRQISGTGGQVDFVAGSFISDGGKSFLCMRSTYTDKATGQIRSRILPAIPQGEIVTSPRSQIHNLVTEWGCAMLAGLSIWDRAEAVINIAHPDFREKLIRKAEEMKVWRRSNRLQS